MLDEHREPPAVARARSRARGAVHAVILVVAVLFIASSAFQLVTAVFGFRPVVVASGGGHADAPSKLCAAGVDRLARALDRAGAHVIASGQTAAEGEDSLGLFRRELSPDWDQSYGIETACGETPQGVDAWAALERLRVAQEQLARRGRAELGPLRREVSAHLPSDLR